MHSYSEASIVRLIRLLASATVPGELPAPSYTQRDFGGYDDTVQTDYTAEMRKPFSFVFSSLVLLLQRHGRPLHSRDEETHGVKAKASNADETVAV